jgi:hypothetical protein
MLSTKTPIPLLTCKRSLVRVQVRPPIFSLVHARVFRVSHTAIRCALDRHGPIGGPIDWVDSGRRSGSVPPREEGIAKLITRRSKVQILPPQPRIFAHAEKGSRKGTGSFGALGPIMNLHFHLHSGSWFARSKLVFCP